LFELLVPIPNAFLLLFILFSNYVFFNDVVIDATELDMFLFFEFDDVNPSFLGF